MASNESHNLPMVVSMGEPAGIGPEVILKAWLARKSKAISPFLVVGDPQYFSDCAKALGLHVPVKSCEPSAAISLFDTALPVLALERPVEAKPGTMVASDSALVSGAIIKAVELVFAGQASAIVTAPINKAAFAALDKPTQDALMKAGATEVYAYITHGVLSGGAVARISSSVIKELVLTDTIEPTAAVRVAKNIRVISIAPLVGEAIARTAKEESVSSLFD